MISLARIARAPRKPDYLVMPAPVERVRDVIDLQAANLPVTVDRIQRAVCAHYEISMNELLSDRRAFRISRPRQMAMYLAKEMTRHTLPAIGRMFGGRDHSTVIHAIRTVERRVADDPAVAVAYHRLRLALGALPNP